MRCGQIFLIIIMLLSFIVPVSADDIITDDVVTDVSNSPNLGAYFIFAVKMSGVFLVIFLVIFLVMFGYFSSKIKKQKNEMKKQIEINATNNGNEYILNFLGLSSKNVFDFCFRWDDDKTLKKWIHDTMGLDHVKIERKSDSHNVIVFPNNRGNTGDICFNDDNDLVTVNLNLNGTKSIIQLIGIDNGDHLRVFSISPKKLKNNIQNKVEELFGKVSTPVVHGTGHKDRPKKDYDDKLLIFINQLKKDLNIYGLDKDVNDSIRQIHEKIRGTLHDMKKMRILSNRISSREDKNKDIDKIEIYVGKCNSIIRSANEMSSIIGKKNVYGNSDIDMCIENMQYLIDRLRLSKDDDSLNGNLADTFNEFIEDLDRDTCDVLNPASIDEYNQIKIRFKAYSRTWNKAPNTKLYLGGIFSNIKTLIKDKSELKQYIEQWNPAIVEIDNIKTDDVILQLETLRHKVANVKQSGVKNDTMCSVILESLDTHLNEMNGYVNSANKLVLSNYIFYYSHVLDMLEHLDRGIPVDDMPNIVKNQLKNTKNKFDKLSSIRNNPDFVEIHPAIPVHFIELTSKLYKWANDLYKEGEFEEAIVMSDACDNTIDYTIALYTNNKFANLLRIITNYR